MLPEPFQFTQSNLQDYVTCPRRFELRYIKRMLWPAVETSPLQEAERRMQLGSDFHRLVHQHILGLPEKELTASAAQSPELAAMWQNYLAHRPAEIDSPDTRLFPEATLSTVIAGHRVIAKYDLLVFLPGQVLIIDWKTNSRRPSSLALRKRQQSRVYPLVLALSGHSLVGTPVQAKQISLQYWFTTSPANPEIIPYSQSRLEQDRSHLNDLVAEIAAAGSFPLTTDDRPCRFCPFRSYCDRGDVAGPLDEFDDDLLLEDFDLDWEQVSEIAY